MLEHNRHRSPALAISLVALFVALGGSAYAVAQITTKDIKRHAVTRGKIAPKAIKSNKVINRTLKGKDLKDGTIGASQLGPGEVNSAALAPIVAVEDTVDVAQGTIGTQTASCPPNAQVIGGGYDTAVKNEIGARVAFAIEDQRSDDGWSASVYADGADNTLTVYAYCLENSAG